jgi:hypothetical protein
MVRFALPLKLDQYPVQLATLEAYPTRLERMLESSTQKARRQQRFYISMA